MPILLCLSRAIPIGGKCSTRVNFLYTRSSRSSSVNTSGINDGLVRHYKPLARISSIFGINVCSPFGTQEGITSLHILEIQIILRKTTSLKWDSGRVAMEVGPQQFPR